MSPADEGCVARKKLFAGTTNANSWMKHAAGVSWLMQQRGPEAHRDSWDCNMLRSFQAITIMNSIFSGVPCFLAGKPWQTLLQANITDTKHPDAAIAALHTIHDQYLLLLTHLPDIIHRGYSLRALKHQSLPITPSQVSILVQRGTRLHSQITALFTRFNTLSPPPLEIPSLRPDPIYHTILWYNNPWHGALRMSFWATLLALQESLVQCNHNAVEYSQGNTQLAGDILRSVECVGTGVMGGYRVGYPVRIAWEVVDERTRGWIKGALERMEGTYAAAGYGTYPG
ncbi:hypothetical protein DL546_000116 [Coniochaeta pulveracea]|uniref:Uncharacterized protein n=1 Tax=Coniochaeta pulveracea TaxID=177199 RepID=A0A420XWN5_9PEZI|nr:hypothetical protein DL546_000116 [Coniochaeta pulveracea]